MDNKALVAQVAKRTGRTPDDIAALIEGLATVIRERCADLDTVAVPGFGNFIPVKEDEKIVSDLSTGKRMMMPPAITLTFHPSGLLRKAVNQQSR